MKKWLLFIPILLFQGCSTLSKDASGSQKIQVRVWQNQTPDMLKGIQNQLKVDILREPIVEFDSTEIDNTIYIAYTTDQAVETINIPSADNPVLPAELANKITATDRILFYQTEQNNQLFTAQYQMERTVSGSTITDSTLVFSKEPKPTEGVWLRLLKGVRSGSDKASHISWSLELATKEPMKISDIKVINLKSNPSSVIAVSNNNQIIIVNDPEKDREINFLHTDLLSSLPKPQKIRNLNIWNNGDLTYISAFMGPHLVTGYLKQNSWNQTYYNSWNEQVDFFQVQMGSDYPYAISYNIKSGIMNLMIYNERDILNQRWLIIDNKNYVKLPQLYITRFKDLNDVEHEVAYVGAIDKLANYFQLDHIRDNKMFNDGPIITDWNERYAIGANIKNQVLYARVNYDQTIIFAALNELNFWESVSISRPPPVKIHPTSKLQIQFINGKHPATVFKQANGALFVLEGLS